MSIQYKMIFDTEGGVTQKPHNIGGIIFNNKGEIIYCFNYLAIDNNCKSVNKKQKRAVNGEFFECVSHKMARKFIQLIKRYNIKTVYGYNISFDKSALKRLYKKQFFVDNALSDLKFVDLYPAIYNLRLLTKKYSNFCSKNGYITPNNNNRATLEIVYRYLINDVNFNEKHTALEDAFITYDIYRIIKKSHGKINYVVK